MGLMHAPEKFDPERGRRFATHATWWIRPSLPREHPWRTPEAVAGVPGLTRERVRPIQPDALRRPGQIIRRGGMAGDGLLQPRPTP